MLSMSQIFLFTFKYVCLTSPEQFLKLNHILVFYEWDPLVSTLKFLSVAETQTQSMLNHPNVNILRNKYFLTFNILLKPEQYAHILYCIQHTQRTRDSLPPSLCASVEKLLSSGWCCHRLTHESHKAAVTFYLQTFILCVWINPRRLLYLLSFDKDVALNVEENIWLKKRWTCRRRLALCANLFLFFQINLHMFCFLSMSLTKVCG